ncbi:MAG: spore coat protein [Clostridia bacterium]|nr:spore coat protein [Clostridia bacterium]
MDTQSIVTSKTGVQRIGRPVTNELPQVKDANVNVRDRINDILSTEKHNLISYQVAINEIINDDLRGMIMDNRNRLQELHTRFFNDLFSMGEYQADAASNMQIADVAETFNNYRVQLPFQQ